MQNVQKRPHERTYKHIYRKKWISYFNNNNNESGGEFSVLEYIMWFLPPSWIYSMKSRWSLVQHFEEKRESRIASSIRSVAPLLYVSVLYDFNGLNPFPSSHEWATVPNWHLPFYTFVMAPILNKGTKMWPIVKISQSCLFSVEVQTVHEFNSSPPIKCESLSTMNEVRSPLWGGIGHKMILKFPFTVCTLVLFF